VVSNPSVYLHVWSGGIMDDLLRIAATLPSFVIYGIVGAVFGVMGVLVAYGFEKVFNSPKPLKIIPILFMVVSTQVSEKVVMPAIHEIGGTEVAINTLKQSRLFSTILGPLSEGDRRNNDGGV
jgi:hypothetical protein